MWQKKQWQSFPSLRPPIQLIRAIIIIIACSYIYLQEILEKKFLILRK